MGTRTDFLRVIDAYMNAPGEKIAEPTLSTHIFNDGKKLGAMRRGADLTLDRYDGALLWLSSNWPAKAKWPVGVVRPKIMEAV
ncbi:hypothetical protein UFOVP1204_53 [uncultured Caudovirales phage]|uniref:Uncharacterized protein n=1 Tax=uncultured Caudovirales phage TaxID=2100421 RepID=A0A6J5R9S9_9CAUD|nr:hypothetical protein UFOVP473_48 [uncultured Caudovirales phage]CAB4176716.1 hypothetical protein UFOVP983_48 [uncultured Caudovirales phage]CAB4190221.1 hypothetical protein UFOVP1204_53 [uncultured Caudovirales phage]